MEALYILFHNSLVESLESKAKSISIFNDRKDRTIKLVHTDKFRLKKEYTFEFKDDEIIFTVRGGIEGIEVKSFKHFKTFVEGLGRFADRWTNPSDVNLFIINTLLLLTDGEYMKSKPISMQLA